MPTKSFAGVSGNSAYTETNPFFWICRPIRWQMIKASHTLSCFTRNWVQRVNVVASNKWKHYKILSANWKKWCNGCALKALAISQPSIPAIAELLLELFSKGRTVNIVSTFHFFYLFHNISLGNHPVLVALFIGFVNTRLMQSKLPGKLTQGGKVFCCEKITRSCT